MTSPQPIEILDLRHFNGRQLRHLLEQEADAWQKRLLWDYRSSVELLMQYLDSRILPGFVALARGQVCGYCFCVYEGHKAVIGDVFVDPNHPTPTAVTHTLIRHLLEAVEASPELSRVEAQLLLFEAGVLRPVFEGFTAYSRLFLQLDLTARDLPIQPAEPMPVLPRALEAVPWSPSFYHATAPLIQACYAGHVDSLINDQYRSLAGSLRFLHNVIRFPGCGTFDPAASWILRDRTTATLAGVLLCSSVAPGVAHVTQLCVLPALRGQRIGSTLLLLARRELFRRGYRAITLTVSEQNEAAVHLYRSQGFELRHRFDALVSMLPGARPLLKRP